jgi:hypothetical protein
MAVGVAVGVRGKMAVECRGKAVAFETAVGVAVGVMTKRGVGVRGKERGR